MVPFAQVLWIVGTAVAASGDESGVAAATDGSHVWVTADGGATWRRAGWEAGDDANGDEDDDVAAAPPAIAAVAILGGELLVATDDGLRARPLAGGPPEARSARRLSALAVDGQRLWAAAGDALLVSADAGRRFRAVGRLPAAPVTSLARAGGATLACDGETAFAFDGSSWRRLTGRTRAVAGAADGSLWRVGEARLERSEDGGATWRPAAPVGGRALAVGAGGPWLATARHVGRVEDPAPAGGRPVVTAPRFSADRALAGAARARFLPEVALVAAVTRHPDERREETVVAILLVWWLDAPLPRAEIARTAAEIRHAERRR